QGTTPALSALAVTIVAVTLLGAILYEVLKRREERLSTRRARAAAVAESAELGVPAEMPA
ncbi:hypothetical protein J8J27_26785, partial [Mycobacterium tuberculosis]|nr:hypothetical protein [Mycobacterium tuberculosis]